MVKDENRHQLEKPKRINQRRRGLSARGIKNLQTRKEKG